MLTAWIVDHGTGSNQGFAVLGWILLWFPRCTVGGSGTLCMCMSTSMPYWAASSVIRLNSVAIQTLPFSFIVCHPSGHGKWVEWCFEVSIVKVLACRLLGTAGPICHVYCLGNDSYIDKAYHLHCTSPEWRVERIHCNSEMHFSRWIIICKL